MLAFADKGQGHGDPLPFLADIVSKKLIINMLILID